MVRLSHSNPGCSPNEPKKSNKKVFAYDFGAIDAEVERLKPLVELGGYLPCPDHRIPPDAKWENVQYYCDRMHQAFG